MKDHYKKIKLFWDILIRNICWKKYF